MPLVTTPNVSQIGESGDQTSGNVILAEGTNITITRSGQTITFASSGGSGSGDSVQKSISQTTHGFSVGDAISFDTGAYVKADASNITKLGIGIVTTVTDANTFTLTQSGFASGLSGLTADQYYFVSASTPGLLTATEPTIPNYSNPLLMAITTTTGWVFPFRPSIPSSGAFPYDVDGGSYSDVTGTTNTSYDGGSY